MDEQTRQFIAAFAAYQATTKAVAGTPNAVYAHGPGGLLSMPGTSPNIVSATVMPDGLESRLPVRLSTETDTIKGILTGLTASTGTEPDAACEDFPQAGNFKMCFQVLPFGRIGRETQIVQVDRAGDIVNRGEWLDHTIVNDPFAGTAAPLPINTREILRNEAARQLGALGVAIIRDYAHLIYDGNPVNTDASTGYIEFNGLDRLVNTGYQDAFTGIACPAADSLVRSFGDVNIETSPLVTVNTISEMYNALKYLAQQLKIKLEWKLVGPYSLFYALTRVWPCAYLTNRCTVGTNGSINVDAKSTTDMRDDMWNNRYLMIDGDRVEFIIDDAAENTAVSAGLRESDLFFIPWGVIGGEPTIYMEYRDMRASNPVIEAMTPTGSFTVLGGGRYLLHKKPPTNECIQARLIARKRLILRTPFLAARLTDVRYTTYINPRSPFPGQDTFYNGGNTAYPAPSFYPFAD